MHPTVDGRFIFWFDASSAARKFDLGDELRFTTFGDSIFVKKFTLTSVSSFAGKAGGQLMDEMSGLASTTKVRASSVLLTARRQKTPDAPRVLKRSRLGFAVVSTP
jgi:hypothetical protein